MSDENRQHIQDGIDGYEAEIGDLNNRLCNALRNLEKEQADHRAAEYLVSDLETELNKLKAANRHRDK